MTLPRTTLVLGGARSGKSAFAERLIRDVATEATYLATAEAGDGEMAQRIARHQAARGPGWHTLEEPLDLVATLRRAGRPDRPILVDCLTLWLSNLMHAGRDIAAETAALAAAFGELAGPVVLVSNEVGQGIVPDNALARAFRDHAGRLHQAVAAAADQVVFVVAGLPMVLKSPAKPPVKTSL
ncbi:MAG TPA: bifunctional adenosylcobinamide kinase/adenosylcobinamide-phosphate guanylyltransferase [Aliidongia sp.]|nr:bifunctional adenosylcobinamide kinase/adenosylcobinamide-phosphate guanylyltransferase [Aliidongia sp.]